MENIPKVGDSFRGWTVGKVEYHEYAEVYSDNHKLIARIPVLRVRTTASPLPKYRLGEGSYGATGGRIPSVESEER